MQTLFKPAIALMNRLRYPYKFMVMGVAVTLVITVMLATIFLTLDRDIQTAEKEIAGLHMLKPVNRMVQQMQQHRGLSSGVLNGNEAMKDKRAAKAKEVAEAMDEVDTKLSPTLRTAARWQSIRKDWETIREQGLNWTAAENILRHTAVIEEVLVLMVDIADETELTLDPAMDTYYFMDTVVGKMPATLEPLGMVRTRGTDVLSRKEITPQQRIEVASLIARITKSLHEQNSNFEKTMHFAPQMRSSLAEPVKSFSDGVENLFALVGTDVLGEKYATPPQEYFAQATKVIDLGYQVMYDVLMPLFEKQLLVRRDEARRILLLNALLTLIVMGAVGYLSVGTYYSVIDSVGLFSRGARKLADGDLTVHFESKGRDELHAAGCALNDMARTLCVLFGRIKGDIEQLRQAADTIATSSHEISESTAAQSDSASSMAASVEEMTVSVDHIAKSAQDAESYSQQSDEVAAEGNRIVQRVVVEIEGIANTVNQSAAAVEALGEQSKQISSIIDKIKEIADQTNLLALNAAIEAARAGETGRGFAVVADEVRKLAERTAKSTQEIADMIQSILSGTTTAVDSMKLGVDRVASGVEQAQAAGTAISQAQVQARQVVEAVSDITTALREQAAASTQIAQNVERIAQMAEENNAAANGNAEMVTRLRQLAETLGGEIARFRT